MSIPVIPFIATVPDALPSGAAQPVSSSGSNSPFAALLAGEVAADPSTAESLSPNPVLASLVAAQGDAGGETVTSIIPGSAALPLLPPGAPASASNKPSTETDAGKPAPQKDSEKSSSDDAAAQAAAFALPLTPAFVAPQVSAQISAQILGSDAVASAGAGKAPELPNPSASASLPPGDGAAGSVANDAAATTPPGAAPVLASSFIAAPAETPAGFVAAPLAPDQAAALEEIVAAAATTATTADTAFMAMRAAPATQQSADGAAVSQPVDVVENNGKPQQGASTAQTAEARQAAKAAIAVGLALDMPAQTAEQVASQSPAPGASAPEKKSSGKSSDTGNSDTSKSTAATLPAATAKPAEAPVPQAQAAQAAAHRADSAAVQAAPTADTGTSSAGAQTSTLSVAGVAAPTTGSAVAQPPRTELPVRLTGLAGDTEGMDALAVRIAVRAAAGENRFDIRLDPPELGRIDVRLDVDKSGQVQAQLSAERPQTLDLLQRDSHALERALRDAGLNAGGGLSFSLKGEGRSGRDRDAEGSRNYARIGAVDELAGLTPALATRWQPNYLGADKRLDITV